MRILKSHPLLRMLNSYLIDSPQPANLSYLWNFGSLLALCLLIQIVTGITLAMHYNPSVQEAFNSVEHIMRDVNNGWLLRYLHSNTASAFFLLVYLHIGRGLYYGSYMAPRTLVWTIGTVIFILMMATAFLGYLYSPKWFELNLNFYFFVLYNIYIVSLFLFTISFVLFYLDDFNFSSIYYIKLLKILSFILFLIIFIIINLSYINLTDLICCVNDKDINLHGHVTLDKDAWKAIGQGISTVGSQIGLGATMVGVSTAVGKVLTKSSMPPLQKAGIIVGASLLAGLGHSKISAINRNSVLEENIKNNNDIYNNTISNINSNVNKFISDSNLPSSPLQDLLLNLEVTSYVCFSLILILIIQIIFKFYFTDKINLGLFSIVGVNVNNRLEFYLNKIIELNKRTNIIWIWFSFIILIFGFLSSAYAIQDMCINMYSYINVHNLLHSNSIDINITSKLIQDKLLNLKIANYICIIFMIYLILLITSKFQIKDGIKLNLYKLLGSKINNNLEYFLNKIIKFNKKMNIFYIVLTIILLIIVLSYYAHICHELYININSYIDVNYDIKK